MEKDIKVEVIKEEPKDDECKKSNASSEDSATQIAKVENGENEPMAEIKETEAETTPVASVSATSDSFNYLNQLTPMHSFPNDEPYQCTQNLLDDLLDEDPVQPTLEVTKSVDVPTEPQPSTSSSCGDEETPNVSLNDSNVPLTENLPSTFESIEPSNSVQVLKNTNLNDVFSNLLDIYGIDTIVNKFKEVIEYVAEDDKNEPDPDDKNEPEKEESQVEKKKDTKKKNKHKKSSKTRSPDKKTNKTKETKEQKAKTHRRASVDKPQPSTHTKTASVKKRRKTLHDLSTTEQDLTDDDLSEVSPTHPETAFPFDTPSSSSIDTRRTSIDSQLDKPTGQKRKAQDVFSPSTDESSSISEKRRQKLEFYDTIKKIRPLPPTKKIEDLYAPNELPPTLDQVPEVIDSLSNKKKPRVAYNKVPKDDKLKEMTSKKSEDDKNLPKKTKTEEKSIPKLTEKKDQKGSSEDSSENVIELPSTSHILPPENAIELPSTSHLLPSVEVDVNTEQIDMDISLDEEVENLSKKIEEKMKDASNVPTLKEVQSMLALTNYSSDDSDFECLDEITTTNVERKTLTPTQDENIIEIQNTSWSNIDIENLPIPVLPIPILWKKLKDMNMIPKNVLTSAVPQETPSTSAVPQETPSTSAMANIEDEEGFVVFDATTSKDPRLQKLRNSETKKPFVPYDPRNILSDLLEWNVEWLKKGTLPFDHNSTEPSFQSYEHYVR